MALEELKQSIETTKTELKATSKKVKEAAPTVEKVESAPEPAQSTQQSSDKVVLPSEVTSSAPVESEEKPKIKNEFDYAKSSYEKRKKSRESESNTTSTPATNNPSNPEFQEFLKAQKEFMSAITPKQPEAKAEVPDPFLDPDGYRSHIAKELRDEYQAALEKELAPLRSTIQQTERERFYSSWSKERDEMVAKDHQLGSAINYLRGVIYNLAEQQGLSQAAAEQEFQRLESEEILKAKKLAHDNGFTSKTAESMFVKNVLMAHAMEAGFDYNEYQGYIANNQEEEPTTPSLNEKRGLKERATSVAGLPKGGTGSNKASGGDKALYERYMATPIMKRAKEFTAEERKRVLGMAKG